MKRLTLSYIGFWAVVLCAIATLSVAPMPCAGQATTGQILGQVTDPSGAVVPNATVTVTDENRGVSFTGRTDAAGNYVLVSLPPGEYSVAASAPGFSTAKAAHLVLAIDQHLELNLPLKVGDVSAQVTVTDQAPLLQTQTAEVGTVIGGDAITDLPLFGRAFYDLTNLVPGVTTGNGSNMNTFNLSVSGQREYANSVQLDGIETTTNRTQDITITPNVDSVDQFKVVTAAYDAEFGNAAGGVVAVQTKAGTNSFHGDAFEFMRPPWMTARQTIPGATGPQPEATLRQNNFGGTLGGPIIKDHSFLFGAYEGMRNHDTYNYITSTIPFQLFTIQPNGNVDFSTLVDPCSGMQCRDKNNQPSGPPAGTVDPLFDPNATVANGGWWTSQFPGNVIPAARVSNAGMNTMLHFFPKPNLPGIENGWFRNFQSHAPENDSTNQVDARFDQVISPKDRLYAVYHWQNLGYLVQDAWYGQQGLVPGAGDADQATNEDETAQSLSLTYDRFFTPNAMNEVRFGYMHYGQNQYSLLNGTDYSSKYGYGNVNVPEYSATSAFPQVWMADGYLAGGSTWKPFHILDENYEIDDSFSWTGVSRHEFKFGTQIRLLNSHPDFSLFPTGFDYYGSFGNAETSAQSWWGYYYCADPTWCVPNGYNWLGGSDVADLVLGLPLDVYMGLQLTNPHTKSWDMSYYAQDSWKITPRLTMNYGLRYDYQAPWTEAGNNMSNFDLASGNILIAGINGHSNSLIQSRWNDISPRLGFAFAIDPKTVLRAGGGIFYSPENDGREDFLTKNNPFALQYSFSNWEWSVPASSPQVWPYQDDAGSPRSTKINIPSTGIIAPKDLVNGNLETTNAINPSIKTGTTGSFDLAVGRQLSRTMSLDVSYVGSISRHLSYQIGDINADPNEGASSGKYDTRITTDLGIIQYMSDPGMSDYNSLQVKLTRQVARSTNFLLSYTYGHSLDNGPAPFDIGNNNDRPQNPYNLTAEYATSDDDVRHNLVFSGDYALPFGRGQTLGANWGTLPNAVLGGWKFGGIFSMRSGNPVNVILGDDPKSALAGVRPNISGDPNLSRGKRNYLHYFNTAAFSAPVIPQGSAYAYGNAGRNLVVGPGFINIDASLAKDFKVENRWTLQVRAEAFNGTNSVHYSNPDGDLTSGTFGQINSTYNPRRAQLAAKFIF